MKTPDEIKKDIIDCMEEAIEIGKTCDAQDLLDFSDKAYVCMATTRAYIQQLESELAAVKRERDALLEYLTNSVSLHCDICKYGSDDGAICCQRLRDLKEKCFEWRGVCPENTEVQDGNNATKG